VGLSIRHGVSIFAIALASVVGGQQAQAQQSTHGCACVHNETQSTVNFRYKWGDGEWKTVNSKPNWKNWICWKYADQKMSSPTLTFQLDVDMTSGNAWTTYNIARVQTTRAHCDAVGRGGHYNIRYRPNTNNTFIQITKVP
jgi:hypothetical protein